MRTLAMLGAAVALALVAPTRPAHAGICLDDRELAGYARGLERFAAGGRPPSEYWLLCLRGEPAFQPRVVAACQTIVTGYVPAAPVPRDQLERSKVQADCVLALVSADVTTVGPLDTVMALFTLDWGPTVDVATRISALAAGGDPRAVALVTARLLDNLAAVKATRPRGWKARAWLAWQREALRLFKRRGTSADVAAVDAILAAATDRALRRQATQLRAALAARPSPAQ